MLNAGPFSLHIGKSKSGWFTTGFSFTENHDTKGALENGAKFSVKLDSVTSRIGSDTEKFILDPATGEKIHGKETRLFGAQLGVVEAETMLGVKNVERNKAHAKVEQLSATTVEVEASPA